MSSKHDGSVRQFSDARLAANRRNSLKSTGPRTPMGKAVVSMNAVRTSLRADSPVVPGESEEEWLAFRDAVLAELRPVGVVQREMAERIARLMWRQRRPGRYEAAMLRSACGPPDGLRRLAEETACDLVVAENALKMLLHDGGMVEEMDDATVALFVEAVADAVDMSAEDADFQALVPDEPWSSTTLGAFVGTTATATGIPTQQIVDDTAELIELRRRQARATLDAANDATTRHRDTRLLLDADTAERIARAEAHLDRSLRRALDELHGLQARRAAVPGRRAAG